MRPSFLEGSREENRICERLGILFFTLRSPILLGPLKKIRPIHSDTVAKAMIDIANKDTQKKYVEVEGEIKIDINDLFEINNKWYKNY